MYAIQTLLVRLFRIATSAQDFGREESLIAWYARLPRRFTHFRLIAVELRGVYVTVSRFEGCEAGVDADVGRRLVDAETEAGNLDRGVGER